MEKDEKKSGFVVRYELLGIIAIMLIQTMGGMWWAATLTSDLQHVKEELVAIKVQLLAQTQNSYKIAEAEKDFRVVNDKIEKLEAKTNKLELDLKQLDKEVIYHNKLIK
jgi:hypothetical protein